MKMALFAIMLLNLAFTPAEAALHPHHYHHRLHSNVATQNDSAGDHLVAHARKTSGYNRVERGPVIGPRPGKWCGWYMRTRHGGGANYNRAWEWSRRGIAGEPQVGAIVVWRHHVGEIVGHSQSGWIVLSGNDGGRVRSRVRSIRGAVVRVI